MASTRDVISPGIFAEDASTTIPPSPIQGVSYRDPVAGPASAPDGWPFFEKVNSAEFNQLLFQYSSLLDIIDLKGLLGWTDLKDYTEDAIVFGSDGVVYKWLQESGPGTSAGVKDPVSEPAYWRSDDLVDTARIDVASASTVDLTASAPNTRHINITGTTTINGFTVAAGQCYFVRFDAALTMTNSASLVTQTGANIVTAAGDTCIIRATAANVVEIICGEFLADRAVGSGQTWQDVKASRVIATTYTNTTGRSIEIAASVNSTSASNLGLNINGVRIAVCFITTGQSNTQRATIPAGATYTITNSAGTPTVVEWWELR
jgi:hypothetical protein